MTTALIVRATIRWHIRKGRRLFDLLAARLTATSLVSVSQRRTGVCWG